MKSRGVLKCRDEEYQLCPKITTIGSTGCDIIVEAEGTESQHAIIEYSEEDGGFILKDLNTEYGTRINDCLVQNAAVRLSPGDQLRFGQGQAVYQLAVQQQPPPAGHPRSHPRGGGSGGGAGNFASFGSTAGSGTFRLGRPTSASPMVLMSGSSGRRQQQQQEFGQHVGFTVPVISTATTTTAATTLRVQSARGSRAQQQQQQQCLDEKDQQLLSLQLELQRFRSLEAESREKDRRTEEMRAQLAGLQRQLASLNDPELRRRLSHLETEVAAKQQEVALLKEQLQRARADRERAAGGDEVAAKTAELAAARLEADKLRRDAQVSGGLITQLQRDMTGKDTTISRLNRELETLKEEVKSRDLTISALQAKFARIKDTKREEEEREAREKELMALRTKFKDAEARANGLQESCRQAKEELEAAKTVALREESARQKLRQELDELQAQVADGQRTERLAKADAQHATQRLERFRNRVATVAYSAPGLRVPEQEATDDQLLELLKRSVEERTEFQRRVGELKESLKLAEASVTKTDSGIQRWRVQLKDAFARLTEKGRLARNLRDELARLTAESTEEALQPLRDAVLLDLQAQVQWQQEIEDAVERCGAPVRLSPESPAHHVTQLYSRWQDALNERERLRSRIAELESQAAADRESLEARLAGETEARVAEALEKAAAEAAREQQRVIDDVVATETERREAAVAHERGTIAELQGRLAALQRALEEREAERADDLSEAQSAVERLSEKEATEAELRRDVARLTVEKEEALASAEELVRAAEARHEKEAQGFKDQVKQHSVTICHMEERLTKVVKQNKQLQEELNQARQEASELRGQQEAASARRREAATTPKVIVQRPTAELAVMERTVVGLRQENSNLKETVQSQRQEMESLRRDLQGMSARLSDIRGELTDQQKEELEGSKHRLREVEAELAEKKEKLAKLTEVAENQAAQLAEARAQQEKHRSALGRMQSALDRTEVGSKDLEARLEAERCRADEAAARTCEEERIAAEMSSLGHQCRGERHAEVIAHQKEALSELRKRLKELERTRPSAAASQDQAAQQQQVTLLKKELAELRAKQAMAETRPAIGGASAGDARQLGASGVARIASSAADLEAERAAHKETRDCLELSEHTYLSLLRGLASGLELESVQGLRSMAHLPPRPPGPGAGGGGQPADQQRVRLFKERLGRKEDLLQGYERDLAKLRQAEELAGKRSHQVDSLAQDLRSRGEEVDLLRESLSRTKDVLNQEKRLNTAIKQKKALHSGQNLAATTARGSLGAGASGGAHCPPEDVHAKEEAKKRAIREKIKRKDYEIRTLKAELMSREKDLSSASSRLVNLESTLGLPHESELTAES
uniref:FHA domain-containing protein n=1 Tax=Macrostomum lignano TaxID=282301 RepID=A0A1I8HE70_9PLAT